MFAPKKCLRCEGDNIRKVQINVLAKIKSYTKHKGEVKRFVAKEHGLVCEDCGAFIIKVNDNSPDGFFSYYEYMDEETLKEIMQDRYEKDEGFKIELLYK